MIETCKVKHCREHKGVSDRYFCDGCRYAWKLVCVRENLGYYSHDEAVIFRGQALVSGVLDEGLRKFVQQGK